jgi:hypothetical protein
MVKAQKIDSIYFHLYTDSLKKGVSNYINVDGKTADGKWLPLTAKEIIFTSSYGEFEGNELILPANFKEEKVKVKAVLKSNPKIEKEITIWIKKLPDPDRLPTAEEVMKGIPNKKNKNKN